MSKPDPTVAAFQHLPPDRQEAILRSLLAEVLKTRQENPTAQPATAAERADLKAQLSVKRAG